MSLSPCGPEGDGGLRILQSRLVLAQLGGGGGAIAKEHRLRVRSGIRPTAAAHAKLGWAPTTTLEELVKEMVDHDQQEAAKEATLLCEGFEVVGSMENPPTSQSTINAARSAAGIANLPS